MTFLAEHHLKLAFVALGHGNTFAEDVAVALSDEWLRSVAANPPQTTKELRSFVERAVRGALTDMAKGVRA